MPYGVIRDGWVEEELVRKTNENNDFTTLIPSWDHFVPY